MIEELRRVLDNMSDFEIKEEWDKLKHLDEDGITVDKFLSVHNNIELSEPEEGIAIL
jgi:hypothetical protein